MKNNFSTIKRTTGFTLIEMLVVIAIISILAGLLLPVLGKAKLATKIKMTKAEMTNLAAAIEAYHAEYGRMPISKDAAASLNDNCPDFTCGTFLPDGTQIAGFAVKSENNSPSYQNANSEVMNILRNIDSYPNTNSICNPRKLSFFTGKVSNSTNTVGIGPDGVIRDSWGNPYIITLDANYDGKCWDGFYRTAQVSQDSGAKGFYGLSRSVLSPADFEAHSPVMIWSAGPDGQINKKKKANEDVNKDNILSWN